MNLFELIRTRRSVRKYDPRPVPWDHIVEIMQAGKYAPYAGNIMSVKFLVVKDENKRSAIADACHQQYWMQDAPVHIVVVGEPQKVERYYGTRGTRLYTLHGAGAAIQNMLLTSHSLGLGSCWVGAFDEEEIKSIVNIPEDLNVQAVVTIGYPLEKPQMPPKNRIEHAMYFEKWGGRIEGPKNALGMWSPAVGKGRHEGGKMIKNAVSKLKEKMKKKKGKK